ncbi:hypothetical protein SPRG_19825 [Saprolegnia parasitica CBS 223.65]|uniref:A to I editase domain-containing protein n=1 Tax=Saprolegnia parasitica (strain CBS 223.65) TaxID=695850 RepID=A0A067CUT3_SAPPC|nr:hypothetical protein SPRG_19825 [Saprolegnia parasitica CBS 223.65]KDO30276.1 hypothetical protein SPRG_19825 [Saprolegnia parasitica CBS 223.65]|eukprot:XP_012199075.1 hypothetical protein SPRG_19825 [Saprolegnia parasitica CBS 223.65]
MAHPDRVAEAVLAWFAAKVPAKKHAPNEYTVLAAIVLENDGALDVLSVGSGTKCLGQSALCPDGYLVHDGHAEVMCRRAFLRYLYYELSLRQSGVADETSIFTAANDDDGRIALKPSCSLHLYVSEAPCGDAALYDIKADVLDEIHEAKVKRRKLHDADEVSTVPMRTTGAKVVESATHSHVRGLARVKSGRTDIPEANRTVSMSCTDKICKWLSVGLQGSLLSQWFAPLHLASVVVSLDTQSDAKSFQEAIAQSLLRGNATCTVATTTVTFPLTRSLAPSTRTSASGLALNWTHLRAEAPTAVALVDTKPDVEYLVSARGLKMGTKKVLDLQIKQKMSSRLARRRFFAAAAQLDASLTDLAYDEAKRKQVEYVAALSRFRAVDCFAAWKGVPGTAKRFTLACPLR